MHAFSMLRTPALLAALATASTAAPAHAQFTVADSVEGLVLAGLAWGDYDRDGRLDLVVVGRTSNPGGVRVARIYRRSSTGPLGLAYTHAGGYEGDASWGDHDGDGFLDPFISGLGPSGNTTTTLYDGPSFTSLGGLFTTLDVGCSAWGDYDNDGDVDLFLGGRGSSFAKVFRNTNGTFAEVLALPGVTGASAAWADYDHDGDLDLAVNGSSTTIYRNSGGANPTLTDIGAGLLAMGQGSVEWGDHDNDGDLDLLLTGSLNDDIELTMIYENGGGTDPDFTQILHGLLNVGYGAARWGDYDNDGRLDAIVAGWSQSSAPATRLYRNLGGSPPVYGYIATGVDGMAYGDVAWGDADADGDLDLAIVGLRAVYEKTMTRIYANTGTAPPNAPPSAPMGLAAVPTTVDGEPAIQFSWTPAVDDVTPQQSLSYNLRVGTTPGGDQVMPSLALASGRRLVPALGNVGLRTTWTLRVPEDTYYWSVQAIDGGFAGSPFAAEQSITSTVGIAPGNVPAAFALGPAAPNPFDGSTAIRFEAPRASIVKLEVFDPAGRRMRTLLDGPVEVGRHALTWDGRDERGRAVPSGVYVIRMASDGFRADRRIVRID